MKAKIVVLLLFLSIVGGVGVVAAQPVEEKAETSSKVNWIVNSTDVDQMTDRGGFHGHPHVDRDGNVYIRAEDGNVTKFYSNGTHAWTWQNSTFTGGPSVTLTIDLSDKGKYVYVADSNANSQAQMVKLYASNGTEVWRQDFPETGNNNALFGPTGSHGGGEAIAVGPNGKIHSPAGVATSDDTSCGNLICYASYLIGWHPNGTLAYNTKLSMINSSQGNVLYDGGRYVTENGLYWYKRGGDVVSIYPNGTEKFATSISWLNNLSKKVYEISGSADGQRIYLRDNNTLGAISTDDGSTIWTRAIQFDDVEQTVPIEGPTTNNLYLGNQNSADWQNAVALRAYNATTGSINWTIHGSDLGFNYSLTDGNMSMLAAPVIGDNSMIYLPDLNGQVYGIYPNGTVRWHINATTNVSNVLWQHHNFPAIAPGGNLYVWTHSGDYPRLLSINTSSSNPHEGTSNETRTSTGSFSHYATDSSTTDGSDGDTNDTDGTGDDSVNVGGGGGTGNQDNATDTGTEGTGGTIFGVNTLTLLGVGTLTFGTIGLVIWRLRSSGQIIWE